MLGIALARPFAEPLHQQQPGNDRAGDQRADQEPDMVGAKPIAELVNSHGVLMAAPASAIKPRSSSPRVGRGATSLLP